MLQEASKSDRHARVAVSAVFFVLGAALGAWGSQIATVETRLGLSHRVLGVTLLAGTLGAVTTMPFSGYLIHRVGSKGAVQISGIGLLLILPLLMIVPNLPMLAVTLYLMGICYGQFDVAMNTQSLVVQERYGRPILSAVHGCYSLGGFAAGAFAAFMASLQTAPFIHLAINSLAMAALLAVSCRWLRPKSEDHLDQEEGPSFVMPKGVLIPLGILTLFSFLGEGALWDWSTVYMQKSLHASRATGALAFGVFAFGMAFGRFIGDWFVQHLGQRKVLIVSGSMAAAGLLGSVCLPVPAVAVAGFAITGLGLANLVPILFLASGRQEGFAPPYGLAAVTTCGYTGFLLGPTMIGVVADWWSLGLSFCLVALLCLLVAIFGPRYAQR